MNPMTIECPVQIGKEGDQFVAHAMSLHVMSCGGTPEEARPALDEAVGPVLEDLCQAGLLQETLREGGYEEQDGMGARAPALGF